jgi:hypothetical protein
MRVAELLRQLADRLEQIENSRDNAAPDQDSPEPSDDDKFMPPMQQKIELLKKGVGVESEFDDDEADKEINVIKKNAGISPAVVHVASDDEPLDY